MEYPATDTRARTEGMEMIAFLMIQVESKGFNVVLFATAQKRNRERLMLVEQWPRS